MSSAIEKNKRVGIVFFIYINSKKNYKKIFSVLGKSCLKNYYLAFDKEQITDFIENVVINGNDKLKKKREIYAAKNLALNYPNVSKKILSEISL